MPLPPAWKAWLQALGPRTRRRPRRRTALHCLQLESRTLPAGVITGFAFEDFNANGTRDTATTVPNSGGVGATALAIDRGLAGVAVTAFDSAGTVQGAAVTAANGSYTLNAAGTGPYRIEFSSLPAGFFPGPHGPDNGTTVQFVPDGATANVSLGLVAPADYLPNNPTLAASSYVFGDQINGPNSAAPVIVTFPYAAGSNSGANAASYTTPTTHALAVPASAVGTVTGMDNSRSTGLLYAAAYMKKHSGFGPAGTGAVYAVNPTTGAVSLLADLNALFGAGTAGANAHAGNGGDFDRDNGNAGWDAVGKTSLGGLIVSPDGGTVYVMNLADRSLYAIPTTGPVTAATVRRVQIPLNAPGATGANGADLRPFAVQFFQGQLYVGIVNSAQSTQNVADLHAYVYTVDPATLTFSAAPVFQFNLNYPRGAAETFNGNANAAWRPWSATFADVAPSGTGVYPQPELSAISFDVNGNMVLGLRDRGGDQYGFFTLDNPLNATRFEGVAAGDTLFAAANTPGNPSAGWALENNAKAGTFGPTGGAGNNQGPGGGEYFFQDNFGGTHQEVTTGTLLQLPGYPDVVTTGFDPGLTVRTGGFEWFRVGNGTKSKGYQLYDTGFNGNVPQPTFSKANGLGSIAALSPPAPFELGNRVWRDANGNGVQDAGEAGIPGVTVHLFDTSGNLLATTVTDATGNYYFSSTTVPGLVPNATYSVRLDNPADFAAGGPLAGLMPTRFQTGADTAVDSNGQATAPTDIRAALPAGGPGASDHTADFGFTPPLSIGDLVFNDANNDGLLDNGETGLDGVSVRLFDGGNNLLGSTVTAGGGLYQFSNLFPGSYRVEITPPAGYVSSTGTNGSASGPFEPGVSGNQDNQDHGTTQPGGVISATVVTLAPAGGNPDTVTNPGDANLRQDFGLFQTLSLGNVVWLDANNNGVQDAGEPGIGSVAVNLRDATGNLVASTATNAVGGYLFTELTPGQYRIEIAASNFAAGGALVGFVSSTGTVGSASGPFEPAPSNNLDGQDKGTAAGGVVQGGLVNLQVGSQPTGEAATPGGIIDPALDANGNLTQDFGFFRALSLGDLVWNDANNDGLLDNGEAGLANVTVNLLDGSGNVVATTTTNGGGNYLFTDLVPGTYQVEIVPLAGYVSSTGTNGSATGPFEPGVSGNQDNQDHGTAQPGGTVRAAAVTLAAPGSAGNPDSAGTANLRQDFGLFQTLSLGNFVWNDTNNNGLFDAGEPGIGGVTVQLLDATGTVVVTTTTNAQGGYLFTDLTPGQYRVQVVTPAGFTSSTGTGPSGSVTAGPFEPAPNNNLDNQDKGTSTAGPGSTVQGPLINLQLGTQPTGEAATAGGITDPALDVNGNLTQDFGFFQPLLTVGDFVWDDANNDGLLDNGESGLANVTVNLLDAGGNVIATTTTNGSGNYSFSNLTPGTYSVEIVPPAGYVSSTGTNGSSTGPFEPGVSGNQDNQDHGTTQPGGTIRSAPFTLGSALSGQNPDANGTANLRQDFGLFQTLSLGNFVWLDANNNGLLDAGEPGIGGVAVNLRDASGNLVASTTTNAAGGYLFTELTPGQYRIEIAASNFAAGGALAGFTSSTGTVGSAAGPFEPAPSNNLDGQDKGTAAGGVVQGGLVNLQVGTQPTGDAATPGGIIDPALDANGNLTQDFGFFRALSLGDLVWNDANNDGLLDNGESGLSGVTVRLLDAGSAVVATTATNASGNYLFTDLVPGTYRVEIVPLAGFVSSTGTNGSATGPFEPGVSGNQDNQDHGTTQPGGTIRASAVTLAAPGSAGNPDSAGTANLRQDFGLFQTLSIGNRLWIDLNNNGVFDAGEPAPSGPVTINLRDAAGNLVATTITNAQGYYLFTDLTPGQYRIEIAAGNFAAGGALAGFVSSTGTVGSATGPFEPGVTGFGLNDQDHGTTAGGVVQSGLVTLAIGTAPTVEPATPGLTDPAADANSDTTVDFGFFRPLSLGDLVFNDANNNGLLDKGESGLSGVTVRLLDGSGNLVATTTTDGSGVYSFTDLIPGSYQVEIVPPAGYVSSTGANGSATGPFEPGVSGTQDSQDHGTTQPGGTVRTAAVTLAAPGAAGNPDGAGTANLRQDFGLFQTLSLGNVVWLDANNNGLLDAGESGIGGVTVNLRDSAGNLVATTTTNAQGGYLFTDLTPGQYRVQVVTPAGFVSSTGTVGSPTGPFEPAPSNNLDGQDKGTAAGGVVQGGLVNLQVGTQPTGEAPTPGRISDPALDANGNLTQDFGFFRPLSLGDLVWDDVKNNGIRDAGEAGLSGVIVRLLDAGSNLVASTTTNGSGNYLFTDLIPGSYRVEIVPPAGYISSTGTNGSATGPFEPGVSGNQDNQDHGTTQPGGTVRAAAITLAAPGSDANPDSAGTANLRQDFGLFRLATVGDRVFLDTNANGIQDASEPGVGGVTVRLRDAAGNLLATTTTSADGSYHFTDLGAGSYLVEFVPPAGDRLSPPGRGGNPALDSDADPITGRTAVFALAAGQNDPTRDAGLFVPASVGDTVFEDLNANGIQDIGEPGVAGVAVQLLDAGGAVVGSATTDAAGHYQFTGLVPGTYSAAFTPPAGFAFTLAHQGADPALDSDADPATGRTAPFSLTSGQNDPTRDAGLVRLTALSGTVYVDTNVNGTRDPGEPGLPGVTLTLTDPTGHVVATTTTGPDGGYQFGPLTAGNYTVTETQPAGYGSSTPNVLAVTVPTTGLTGQDFGETQASISGTVYIDFDLDGLRQPAGEPGIPGVTVALTGTDAAGAAVSRTTTTAADGSFAFTGLLAGTYTLTETQPAGFFDGLDAVGSSGGITGNDVLSAIPLGPGVNATDYLFGEFPPADPFGFVYVDANNNGHRDPGEAGIPGVAVTIAGTAFAGTPMARPLTAADVPGGSLTVRTGPDGGWAFADIPPGLYSFTETQPAGFLDGLEENADPHAPFTVVVGNDVFSNVVLAPNPVRGPFNFGELTPGGTVSGLVFVDTNGNGTPDLGEPPVTGAVVRLTGTDDLGRPVDRTLVTGPDGRYEFTNVRPGTYTLTRTDPSGTTVQGGVVVAPGAAVVNEDFPEVPATAPSKSQLLASTPLPTAAALPTSPTFGNSMAATGLGGRTTFVVTGADAGSAPRVRVFDFATGTVKFDFLAYDAGFTGGVRVAVGDVNGDGIPDIITAAGPGGGPHVKVFDGATGALLASFMAYDPSFTGGVYVAVGDLDGDGKAEVITGAGAGGGPHVKAFDPLTVGEVASFFAYDAGFTGGVRVAAGDLHGDGRADIITGAGPGGGPHVKAFDGQTLAEFRSFFAYDPSFTGGVFVAAGDVNGDGIADIVTGAGPGGGPHVKAFDGQTLAEFQSFFAFEPGFTGGVRVGVADVNGDGKADLVTGTGTGDSRVRIVDPVTGGTLDYFQNDPAALGGTFVAAG